ncbi:MAG: hypothetical protein ACK55K_03295 [Bacteroidota bacterium]
MRQKITIYKSIRPTEKELAFFDSWTLTRTQPKWMFILFQGILKESLLVFIIIKVFQILNDINSFSLFYNSASGILFLLFEIIFWLISGFVIGWFKYNTNEIEYELIKGFMD